VLIIPASISVEFTNYFGFFAESVAFKFCFLARKEETFLRWFCRPWRKPGKG